MYSNKDFDLFTKKCMNSYCKKEFRSEDYYQMKDICASCGSELRFKHEVEETTSQKIKDRTNGLEILSFLQKYIKELETLPFPSKPTLTAFSVQPIIEQEVTEKKNKKDNDSDIDENLMKFIDYDLKYIKLSKDFFKKSKKEDYFLGNKAKFSDTLKNIKKEVKCYFRIEDMKRCISKSRSQAQRGSLLDSMRQKRADYSGLPLSEYRKLYKLRMTGKINLS
jgi:hypothetical protein